MPSPACTVQDGGGAAQPTTGGVNVGAGDTITIQLVDLSATQWSIQCLYTDELQGSPPALTVNSVAKSATFTAPPVGSACIFQSQVNLGRDTNGNVQPAYTTTFGVYVLSAIGARVFAANEEVEGSALFGWITKINPFLRGTYITGNSYTVHKLTSAGQGPTYQVTETSGYVLLSHTSLTAAFTDKFPASPQIGMAIVMKAADTTFSNTNTLTANGNGNNVEWEGSSAATQTFNPGTMGTGGAITWVYNGTIWVST